jgi:hypothetical protein
MAQGEKSSKKNTLSTVESKLVTKPNTRSLIKEGMAKRRDAKLPLKEPTALGKQIAHIAGKHNVAVEWTVKPLDPGDVAACACHCSWVCSCYAMPQSHLDVVLDPATVGRKMLQQDNLDLGHLFKQKKT